MMEVLKYSAVSYIACSLFFFLAPTSTQRKLTYKNEMFNKCLNNEKILRISHRGGPHYTTQNTIEAFKKAVQYSDMLEMDVCMTKDHVLVVHHDEKLSRTCGVDKKISQFNYDELPQFLPEIRVDFSPDLTMKTNNERIPTLEEVFKIFQHIPMNIELKTPSLKAENQLLRLILEHDRKDITIVGTRPDESHLFNHAGLISFHNQKTLLKLFLFYITGLIPFTKFSSSTLQLPLYTKQFYQWKLNTSQNKWKVHGFFTMIRFMNFFIQPLVWHLKKRGIMTYYWVCNNRQEYQRAINLGACGIMTDDPIELDKFIKEREAKQPKKYQKEA